MHKGLVVLALVGRRDVNREDLDELHRHILSWDRDELRAAVAYLESVSAERDVPLYDPEDLVF